jgi:hypothetical protein
MLERKVTYYKPHGACWRLSNDYFDLDVDDNTGVMQGLYFKNDFNDANFMGNEENTQTNVAWRDRYVKDMNHRAPMHGWTGDLFMKIRNKKGPEDKLKAMYTCFSDDIRKIECSETSITCSYTGNSEYVGGLRGVDVESTYSLWKEEILWDFALENTLKETLFIGDLGFPMVLNTSQYLGSAVTGLNHRSVHNEKFLNENRFRTHFNAAGHSSCYTAVRYGGIGDYLVIIPSGDTFIETIGAEGDYGHDSMMKAKGPLVFLYTKSATQKPYENQATEMVLEPGEKKQFGFRFMRAKDFQGLKDKLFMSGKIDVKVIPGMVIPFDGEGKMLVRSIKNINHIEADDGISIEEAGSMGSLKTFRIRTSREGELKVRIDYGDGEWTSLVFYGTAPLEELMHKRADFIRKHQQVTEPSDPVQYAFRSWDNDLERAVDVDMVPGLGTCYIGGGSDTGFAPPLFLSAKNVMFPNQDEINALDDFIEKFLYGLLQDKESFRIKNGIYDNYQTYEILKGTNDFKQIENFLIVDDEGRETTWRRWDGTYRIYDYPHAYNIYYSMFRIAKYTDIKVSRSAKEYLLFAFKTAMAVYLDSTYADKLITRGFSNWEQGNVSESHAPLGSFRLPDILQALEEEGLKKEKTELFEIIKKRSKHFISEEYSFCNEFLLAGANTNHGAVYTYAKIVNDENLKRKIVRMIAATKGPFPRWYHYGALSNFIGNYMTSLHAVPLLDRYEDTGDGNLLQLAYGSFLGHWCCVGSDGRGYNSREWRFNPVGRDDPRYNYYVNEARSDELGIGLNCNLRFLGASLALDEHFGLAGYGCFASETEDSYQLEPWSGFGFRVNVFPLGIKLETINVKIKALQITKEKDSIEITVDEAVPEIKRGAVLLKGLYPGTATVSKGDESIQMSVPEGGHLVIEGISPGSTVKICQ